MDEHDVDFQSVSVLSWEPDLHRRLSLESWYIRTLKTFNREKGVLDNKYNSFVFFLISHSLSVVTCHCSLICFVLLLFLNFILCMFYLFLIKLFVFFLVYHSLSVVTCHCSLICSAYTFIF